MNVRIEKNGKSVKGVRLELTPIEILVVLKGLRELHNHPYNELDRTASKELHKEILRAMKDAQDWRNEPATERQKAYIMEMRGHSVYDLPRFDLEIATKGEAQDYIDNYSELANMLPWQEEF